VSVSCTLLGYTTGRNGSSTGGELLGAILTSERTVGSQVGRGQLKCDGTHTETRFRLPAKRTSTFKSAGGVSSVDYWLPLLCINLYHHISTGVYNSVDSHNTAWGMFNAF